MKLELIPPQCFMMGDVGRMSRQPMCPICLGEKAAGFAFCHDCWAAIPLEDVSGGPCTEEMFYRRLRWCMAVLGVERLAIRLPDSDIERTEYAAARKAQPAMKPTADVKQHLDKEEDAGGAPIQ